MPCYSPLRAYQYIDTREVVFKETANTRPLQLPCGQCIGCRLEKSRQWAIRCLHEAQMHEKSIFATLTYSDDELPEHGTLYKPHLQKFFKRLRKTLDTPIRYYACGEYGEQTNRAHYHACIFGADFDDKIPFKRVGGNILYISKKLTEIWGHGQTSIGELNFETAAYCARYVTKKLSKGQAKYQRLDEETGELIPLVQPFAVMSLRPAIGRNWIEKYHGDIYNADKDFIMVRGRKMRPAKYYDKIFDTIDNDKLEHIKKLRKQNSEGLTEDEMRARAEIAHARTKPKSAF